MSRSRRFTVFVPVVSIFAALSLSAMAQEPPKKPPPKAPAVQQKGPVGPGPQVGHGPPGHGGPPAHAVEHHPMGRDPGHWTDRDRYAWGHGSWRPYGCHFGRCGYWWWADGYWYFYDHPMEGPPVEVSEYAYPDPSAPPPSEGYAEPPPPATASSARLECGRGRNRRQHTRRHTRRRTDGKSRWRGRRRHHRRNDRRGHRRTSRAAERLLFVPGRLLLPVPDRRVRRH